MSQLKNETNQKITLYEGQHELLEKWLGDLVVATHVAQQSQQDLQACLTVADGGKKKETKIRNGKIVCVITNCRHDHAGTKSNGCELNRRKYLIFRSVCLMAHTMLSMMSFCKWAGMLKSA